MVVAHPTPAMIRGWLDDVLDPELPVLSIADLGVLRDVRIGADASVTVALTPTYSGCPALAAMARDVTQTLQAHGVAEVRIETQLAPAWTTDWISARGRARLREFGIEPPARDADAGLAYGPVVGEIVRCPRCRSGSTRELSHFGSTACKALYRCERCGEPFDYVKPH